jgi:hypothetical protein
LSEDADEKILLKLSSIFIAFAEYENRKMQTINNFLKKYIAI